MEKQSDYGPAISVNVKDFSLRHTFESAQPLTFYADYSAEMNMLRYASDGIPMLVRSHEKNGGAVISAYGQKKKKMAEELVKRFRLDDDMRSIYKAI
ncbi:hypothetical protein M1583_00460, partial [Candidatus Marsarchaeota archaeon]|nr:hypothetical protein [Candidatus Marsarchaeota archaeon]